MTFVKSADKPYHHSIKIVQNFLVIFVQFEHVLDEKLTPFRQISRHLNRHIACLKEKTGIIETYL